MKLFLLITKILDLDKTKVHSRLRISKQNITDKQNSFPNSSSHKKTNINVMDDQFFICHKDIAQKVFSIESGDVEIERDRYFLNGGGFGEHRLTYIVNSKGIQIEPLKLISKIRK